MSRDIFLNNQYIMPTEKYLYRTPRIDTSYFASAGQMNLLYLTISHHLSGISLDATSLTPHPHHLELG